MLTMFLSKFKLLKKALPKKKKHLKKLLKDFKVMKGILKMDLEDLKTEIELSIIKTLRTLLKKINLVTQTLKIVIYKI